jgi:hypothetical protein
MWGNFEAQLALHNTACSFERLEPTSSAFCGSSHHYFNYSSYRFALFIEHLIWLIITT